MRINKAQLHTRKKTSFVTSHPDTYCGHAYTQHVDWERRELVFLHSTLGSIENRSHALADLNCNAAGASLRQSSRFAGNGTRSQCRILQNRTACTGRLTTPNSTIVLAKFPRRSKNVQISSDNFSSAESTFVVSKN